MGFNLFIAKRIFKERSGEQSFARPAILIAIAGIAVGMIVMIISVAVVYGFKHEISGKVIGFGSHVQIVSQTVDENRQLMPVSTDEILDGIVGGTPGLIHFQEFVAKSAIIKTDEDFRAIHLKGVGEDYDMSFIKKYLLKGEIPAFSSSESTNQIVISKPIASEMRIDVGNKIYVYFIDEHTGNVRARRFEVAGIYQTHLNEYDKQNCFTDIYTMRRLNNWTAEESSVVEIRLTDIESIGEAISYLTSKKELKTDNQGCERGVFSITNIAPHIFAWLDVLDMNVVMILILMLAIGGFTVMSGLLIVMLDRIKMIGTLKALGATNLTIRGIFSDFAIMIVGEGILIGDAVGLGLCLIQKHFSVVSLNPDTYYIDTVPIDINWFYVMLINVGVLAISSMVIFGSSFLMSVKGPTTTMQWD